jgi:hypothetical protein
MMLLNSSKTLSGVLSGKGASKVDGIFWGRILSHIYENPVEAEVGLVASSS